LGVRKAELNAGQDRMQALSLHLGNMLSTSIHSLVAATYATTNKSSVRSFVSSGGKDSAIQVNELFQNLLKDTTNVQVQLFSASHTLLLNSSQKGIQIPISLDSLFKEPIKDSGRVGKIYSIGDSIFYPILSSVPDGNKTIGYCIRWRMMQSRSGAVNQLTELMRTDVKL